MFGLKNPNIYFSIHSLQYTHSMYPLPLSHPFCFTHHSFFFNFSLFKVCWTIDYWTFFFCFMCPKRMTYLTCVCMYNTNIYIYISFGLKSLPMLSLHFLLFFWHSNNYCNYYWLTFILWEETYYIEDNIYYIYSHICNVSVKVNWNRHFSP